MIRQTITLYVLFCIVGVCTVQATITVSADPNHIKSDPNMPATQLLPRITEPNIAETPKSNPILGTLALNWLYQGKQPIAPLVGNEKVTFRTGTCSWPYLNYDNNRPFFAYPDAPCFFYPHNSTDYEKITGREFTYPLNYAEMQMMLDTQVSLSFGAYFFSDLLIER